MSTAQLIQPDQYSTCCGCNGSCEPCDSCPPAASTLSVVISGIASTGCFAVTTTYDPPYVGSFIIDPSTLNGSYLLPGPGGSGPGYQWVTNTVPEGGGGSITYWDGAGCDETDPAPETNSASTQSGDVITFALNLVVTWEAPSWDWPFPYELVSFEASGSLDEPISLPITFTNYQDGTSYPLTNGTVTISIEE